MVRVMSVSQEEIVHQRNGDADNGFPGNHPGGHWNHVAVRVRGTAPRPEPCQSRAHQHGKRIEEGQNETQAKAGGRGIHLPYFGRASSTKTSKEPAARPHQMQVRAIG